MKMKYNSQQKTLLKMWIGCCRKIYNFITYNFKETNRLLSLSQYRILVSEQIETNWIFMKNLPYNSKDETIKDAISNIKTILTLRQKETNKKIVHSVPFRRKKTITQIIPVRAQNIDSTNWKIYPSILYNKKTVMKYTNSKEEMNLPKKNTNKIRKNNNNKIEGLVVCDSKLQYNTRLHSFDLIISSLIPYKKQHIGNENQVENVVALDPGNRTFLTGYSPTQGIFKIGDQDGQKLIKLCLHLDKLISKRSTIECRKRNKLKKAEFRLRNRIVNLRKDIHLKTANMLTKEYDVIIIPQFNFHKLSKKSNRVINNKTVRGLMTWSHGLFISKLKEMALREQKKVLIVSEAYTSKSCSSCGWIDNKLYGKEIFYCKREKIFIDRDVNGARGILLRALLDGSLEIKDLH